MPYETLVFENEEGIAVVTLNRPNRLNALNTRMKEELSALFAATETDESVRVVILTGGPTVFCAGADVKERSEKSPTPIEFFRERERTLSLFSRIENFRKPVIAAVSGIAFGGGCELCLVCDLRMASDTARFALPEAKIGAIPSGGGTQRLPRLIGSARAKELLFTGNAVDAAEACRIGLVNRVVPGERLLEEARSLAREMIRNAPLAIEFAKRAVNIGTQMDLSSALHYEAHCASLLASSEDRIEGFKAFAEKRPPNYKGR